MSDKYGLPLSEYTLEKIVLPTNLRLALLMIIGLWLFYMQLNFLAKRLPHLNTLLYGATAHTQLHQRSLPVHSSSNEPKPNHVLLHHFSHMNKKLTKIFAGACFLNCVLTTVVWLFISPSSKNPADEKIEAPKLQSEDQDYYSNFFLISLAVVTTIHICKTIYDNSSFSMQHVIKRTLAGAQIESHNMNRLLFILFSDTLTSYSKPVTQFCQINMPFLQPSLVSCIGLLPASIRFVQCIREENYWNCFKYSLNFPIFYCNIHQEDGQFENLKFYLLCFQSFYTFWWDCTMDWGLNFMNIKHSKKLFYKWGYYKNMQNILREHYIFPEFYYLIIVIIDLVLRFMWLNPFLSQISNYFPVFVLPGFLQHFLEIWRRWLWIGLRLEYEHGFIKTEVPA
ncbi:hypothetical protein ACO0QE_004642 [Hanseniaspora vineae]